MNSRGCMGCGGKGTVRQWEMVRTPEEPCPWCMRRENAEGRGSVLNLGLALAFAGVLAARQGTTLPRWACSGCGLFYGEPGKVRYGYCSTCWNVWLAEHRLNIAREQLAWQRQRMARFLEMGAIPT